MKFTENKNQDSKVESPPWRIFRNKERRIIFTHHRMPIIIIEGRAVQFRAKRKISEFPVAIIKIIRKDGTFRPTPCVCAGCSSVWLNRKSAGHPSSFVPLLLPASWLPEAALRIMGVHTHIADTLTRVKGARWIVDLKSRGRSRIGCLFRMGHGGLPNRESHRCSETFDPSADGVARIQYETIIIHPSKKSFTSAKLRITL